MDEINRCNYLSVCVHIEGEERKASVDLPSSITVGYLLEQAQQRWNLPNSSNYSVMLKRTGERLNLSQSFETLEIENNEVLVICPELKGELSISEFENTRNNSRSEDFNNSSVSWPYSKVKVTSVFIYLVGENRKASVDLPSSITVGELLQEARERWNLPISGVYSVIVARTCERLNISQTFETIEIEEDDTLLVIYSKSEVEFDTSESHDTQRNKLAQKLDASSPLSLTHSGVNLTSISESEGILCRPKLGLLSILGKIRQILFSLKFCFLKIGMLSKGIWYYLFSGKRISARPGFLNIIVRSVDGSHKETLELPVTLTAEQLLNRVRQLWDLPSVSFLLVLEGSGKVLNLSKTLEILELKNNDTIIIAPNDEGGGMFLHGLIVEQLESDGSLKTFKMYSTKQKGELIVALADEYEEPREGPFYFLERQDAETFSKGFAECQSRRLGKRNFRCGDKTYEFYAQWRGIPTERNKISYYALSLPEYAIPEIVKIVNPSNLGREFHRSVVRDDQTNRFIVYLECRSSSGCFDFDLMCKFIIEPSKFSSSEYSDEFTTSYGYPDTWKRGLEAEETAKVQDFFREPDKRSVEMNFYAPVGNAAAIVQESQESSNTTQGE